MISIWHALLLGLCQGLTEFLPISSSAHLQLLETYLGISSGPSHTLFHLSCHLGTAFVTIFFFRKELMQILFSEGQKRTFLILSLCPLPVFYLLLKSTRTIFAHPRYLSISLIFTAFLLWLGHRAKESAEKKNPPLKDAFWIGSLQGLALIPGISRSASTLSCARLLRWNNVSAVRFSFLLSIPTIMGGTLLQSFSLLQSDLPLFDSKMLLLCLIGFSTAALSGALVIRPAITWLEKGDFRFFYRYCFLLGLSLTLIYGLS
jgi:undecaprenyl-diphosphatase